MTFRAGALGLTEFFNDDIVLADGGGSGKWARQQRQCSATSSVTVGRFRRVRCHDKQKSDSPELMFDQSTIPPIAI
ncbi:hypothetical protein [Paracraurococcus lichenis]|uniref:Uncharacterized protein n=1 Tax=Paracraurococcus lichenis TaxID=3064888 RepID=A0ABT9E7U5_9PROT|nr:hypothetical protein [Paracraurococcus sp. LOR1-02]MDO9712255.1 hypothetical protein [Paracraurococcus sp. LOR1-02]